MGGLIALDSYRNSRANIKQWIFLGFSLTQAQKRDISHQQQAIYNDGALFRVIKTRERQSNSHYGKKRLTTSLQTVESTKTRL